MISAGDLIGVASLVYDESQSNFWYLSCRFHDFIRKQVTKIFAELAAADKIRVTFYPIIGNFLLNNYYQLTQFDVPEKVPRDKMIKKRYNIENLLSTCGIIAHYDIEL